MASDRAEILRGLKVYHCSGDTFEIRIPGAGKAGTISGYFTDFAAAADASLGRADEFAVYVTINPTNPKLIARANNRLKTYAKSTTSDSDIVKLNWLPMDGDPPRPAGIPSTNEEHDLSLRKCAEIRDWLVSNGWPANAFVRVDSGNGGYLLARIELENTTENHRLVERCLKALDYLYSDEGFTVDTTSANPARILRVPGTMNAKGDEVGDMRHRMARILEAPESFEVVPRELLEAVAGMLPEQDGATQNAQKNDGKGFDPVAYCQAHNLQVHHTKNWTDPKGVKCTVAVLEQCVFNPDHHLSAVIIGWPNGMRSYRCRHNSCLNKRWADAKAVIEPEKNCDTRDPSSFSYTYEEMNPPLTRKRCDEIEAVTGCHIYNAIDDPKPNEISEEELNAYSLPEGPRFECRLPKDHFIQKFMAYGSEISDAYDEYWFAGSLFALAVVADKKLKVVLKQGTIYPNLYISINGKSSLARKSTAVDKTEATLCHVLPSLLLACVPTEFSPEAFTEHMSDFNHAPWIRDEAAGVLSLMKKDYMRGFKDSLMQLYDCKPFYRKLRTSQRKNAKTEFRVDDPYLNVLFATTDASLGANTEQNDTLSGFMARFLFFFPQGKKTKWLPLEEGTAANSMFEDIVRDQLTKIAAKMTALLGCMALHFSPEAAIYYTEWQRIREEEWTASNDGNAMQIYSRLAPTVTKLAMLFELGSPDFEVSRPMRLEFIEEACRLVDTYFMPTARAVYDLVGSNAEKNVIDRIIAYLKKHNGKATKKEIMRDIKIKSADFRDYLDSMIESNTIETKTVNRCGKGRDSLWVFLLDHSAVGNVGTVATVAKIAKVDGIHPPENPECIEGISSTLATQATEDTLPFLAAKEEQNQSRDEHFRDQAAKYAQKRPKSYSDMIPLLPKEGSTKEETAIFMAMRGLLARGIGPRIDFLAKDTKLPEATIKAILDRSDGIRKDDSSPAGIVVYLPSEASA